MKSIIPKRSSWRTIRVYFRRFRMVVWVLILLLVATLVYLNQIGLPDFVKKPLLEKLQARGIDLQFSRLRLRWYQGIVAENVHFEHAHDPFSPRLTVREVKVSLAGKALARLKFQVDSLMLNRGRLVLPVAQTNGPPREILVENIQTDLRLLPNDQWALDNFTAAFAGAKVQLSGSVSNASAIRHWKVFSAREPPPPDALQNRLRQLADTLERIRFSAQPDIRLQLRGDALDPRSFSLQLAVSAPGADTPWGTVSHGRFLGRLRPATPNDPSRATLTLDATAATTEHAAATNLHLVVHLTDSTNQTHLVNADLTAIAGMVDTPWGNAANAQLSAHWLHSLTNPVPLSGEGHLYCDSVEAQLGDGASARTIEIAARFTAVTNLLRSDDSWGWWTNLASYSLDWACQLNGIQSPQLLADSLGAGGHWLPPSLTITNLHADLYQGQIDIRAALDVKDRALKANFSSDVDLHKLSALLTEGGRRWLGQFSWKKPPLINAETSLRLPAWTNRHPDWRVEVQPTLYLDGKFSIDHGGAFRDVPVTSGSSHFIYSNMVWLLPDLAVTRPEGRALAFHRADDRTKEFYWKIQSSIDPQVLRPLFETNDQRHFELITFTQPPLVDGEIWGRWREPERIGFRGKVALTNFTFRGESASSLQASVQYSNRFLFVTNAQALRGAQHMSADFLEVDFPAEKIYLTNGFSTGEPQVIARAIGPKIARTIEPYHFSTPPTARVNGIIPLHRDTDADLHFDIEGGPFHWYRFNLARVSGHVHWKGEHLALQNLRANVYGGNAAGSAAFDFTPHQHTDFQFNIVATNALLQLLMADVSTHTNNLEGRLSGSLVVNKANSEDWRSWQGGGNVELKDGLIWDIPMFGIFSPVLNTIAPGLGSSRANAATGSFVIADGIVRSDDLEIRSPAMRLDYRGSVSLQGDVNARVEAELLRDMWLFGPIVSTIFWPVTKLFEYKVAGSLNQPRTDQVYFLGKVVLMPFHPFRTIKDFLPEDSGATRTGPSP